MENPSETTDPFLPLQLLISQIDSESRAQEVVDKARDLNAEERRLLVDILSTLLHRSKALSQRHAHAWFSLIKIASSAQIFARTSTIKSEYLTDVSACVKVVRQSKNDTTAALDVADGLNYMHQLNIVHGALNPRTVLISNEGRALITDLDTSSNEDLNNAPLIRYLAPESSSEDNSRRPTKAADIWSFACLAHEVLSEQVPFCQFPNDLKAAIAIGRGDKPARPGQDGRAGSMISDGMWSLLMTCWEYKAADRPTSSKLQEMLLHMHTDDDRPEPRPMIVPEALETSVIDLEATKAIFTRVVGSHQPAWQVPKHLHDILSRLVHDSKALDAATVAAKKLNHGDTQTLVDFLELVVKDLPELSESNHIGKLLQNIMDSTHIFPQYCRVNGVRYDATTLISETYYGNIYEGRGLKIRICVPKESFALSYIVDGLAQWANASHQNVLPFHGVFHQGLVESPRLCVVLPHLRNGTLQDYAPTLPQKSRMLLISDVINGHDYLLNTLNAEGYLTGRTVVISDEGRAVIAAFGAKFTYFEDKTYKSWDTYTDRFLPSQTQGRYVKKAIWSFGCLSYQVLSRKLPYYHCSDEEVYSKIREGELLMRPDRTDDEMDEIDDKAWHMIMKCCALNPDDRPDCSQIQAMLADMEMGEDRRPSATPLPLPEIQALRSRPEFNLHRAEAVVNQVQAEVLRGPLSELIKNHTKDVATPVIDFERNDIQTMVDFLDQALKESLSISEERNRVLAVLSRITSSTLIFPQRYELKAINLRGPRRFLAEGGCGTVFQGADPTVCIKSMKRLDTGALTPWVKEVILWAHSSHPNVLPFLGVFLDTQSNPPQTCLVSPFMKNGNLREYAVRLAQKSRLPLIFDVVNGLCYLHDLGVVHGDLKGENVLISDEGRGLITDFGASHINTATAATGSLSLTTLRFSAPETVLGNRTPTKKFDIWSLGSLIYEVLSRKPPYYQYKMEVQIISALTRKEMPKRPGSGGDDDTDEEDEYDWDDIKHDYDSIDDQAWGLISKCCSPEPEDRPDITHVRELVIDLRIHDDRPESRVAPGTEILKLRVDPMIDYTRVERLLGRLRAHNKSPPPPNATSPTRRLSGLRAMLRRR
ncbi:Serine/threonine-protein kinase HT1 [Leucoagaricus sp. SymC.cos]|nr:Serine/threonine-protein kinase HT1 [Leucoagaricus sp. SymC.cos]